MKKKKNLKLMKCKICNTECKGAASISRHLRQVHNIVTDEDKLKYLLEYDTENNYYCETGDGTLKEFKMAILSEYPIDEKCYKLSEDKYKFIKSLDTKFDKHRKLADYLFLDLGLDKSSITLEIVKKHKSQFSATSIEYFLKKTDGDFEKARELQRKRQRTTTKEAFISKYGKEEGLKKYKSHFDNLHSKTKGLSYNTLESFIKKYGEEEGTRKFKNKLALSAPTLENFIKRHGTEKGTEKYNSWKKSTSRTLENFQKTYGKEEGEKRYKSYRSKFGSRFGTASKESLVIFKQIVKYLELLNLKDEIYYGADGKKEYFLYDKVTDNFYLYDFTIRSAKIIIEYNGLAYHPSREKLTENEWLEWREPYSKMTADEKFIKDQSKLNFAKKQGFSILEIWSDIPPEDNIKIVKAFINKHLKLI